jgi:prolyl-tRNA synthetase
MFTLLVKDLYSSYKDLPLSIYQIQIKYRDESGPARASCAAASS